MPWYYWSVSMSRYTFGETSARGTDIEADVLSAAISNAGAEFISRVYQIVFEDELVSLFLETLNGEDGDYSIFADLKGYFGFEGQSLDGRIPSYYLGDDDIESATALLKERVTLDEARAMSAEQIIRTVAEITREVMQEHAWHCCPPIVGKMTIIEMLWDTAREIDWTKEQEFEVFGAALNVLGVPSAELKIGDHGYIWFTLSCSGCWDCGTVGHVFFWPNEEDKKDGYTLKNHYSSPEDFIKAMNDCLDDEFCEFKKGQLIW